MTHNQEVVGVTSGLFLECFLYVYCIISCEFNQNVILYCLTVCRDDLMVKELDSRVKSLRILLLVAPLSCNSRQVVHTNTHTCLSRVIWYWPITAMLCGCEGRPNCGPRVK